MSNTDALRQWLEETSHQYKHAHDLWENVDAIRAINGFMDRLIDTATIRDLELSRESLSWKHNDPEGDDG